MAVFTYEPANPYFTRARLHTGPRLSEVASSDPKAADHAVSGSTGVYNVVEAGRFVTMGQGALTPTGPGKSLSQSPVRPPAGPDSRRRDGRWQQRSAGEPWRLPRW